MAETNSNKTFTSNRHGKSVRLTFFPLNSQKEKLKMLNTLKKKSGSVATACLCPLPQ